MLRAARNWTTLKHGNTIFMMVSFSLHSFMLLMMMSDDQVKHHEQDSVSLWFEGMPRNREGYESINEIGEGNMKGTGKEKLPRKYVPADTHVYM